MNEWVEAAKKWFETYKKWVILGAGVAVLLIAAVIVINLMSGEEKKKEIVKIEGPTGPDPKIARIAEFVRQVEAADAKGEFKDALFALNQIAILDPNDPHLAAQRPRLEELVRRLEAWERNQRQIDIERKEAQRLNTLAAWQKVLDLCAEADKNAP
ncbi:MAG TPA: hypothetical protein VKU80_18375, partial [Planctomycetota bacterium]|nr:hypothetical protein [Planctomycetota bacterium]